MMRRLWAILCITAIALVSVRPARTMPADVQVRRDVDLFHSFGRYLREKLVHGREVVFDRPLVQFFQRASTQGEWFKHVLKGLEGYFPFDPNLSGQLSLFFSALVEGTWFEPQNNGTCQCCDPSNPLYAYHVHIGMTGNAGEVVISYNTQEKPPQSCLYVAEEHTSNQTKFCTEDVRTTSLGSGLSPFLCTGWSGYASHVKVNGLQPGKRYTYTIPGSPGNVSYTFMAPYGNTTKTTKLAYFTDIGTKGGEPVINTLLSRLDDFDYMIMPGDQSYCDGYHGCFDAYMKLIQPLAAQKPYMVATGNHEGPWNFSYVRTNFYFPVSESGAAPDALWYSFDEGPIHFVMMNYENYFDYPDGEWSMTQPAPISTYPGQIEWLRRDLEAFAKRREHDPSLWLIMMAHRPLTCNVTDKSCNHFGPILEQDVFPLMYEYKADMYWCGHVHAYERVSPINNVTRELCSDCVRDNATLYYKPPYPVQIMNGIAGRAVADNDYFTPGVSYPPFVAQHYSSINYPYGGYALVSVDNNVLNFTLYNTSGAVLDHFRIEK
ncbi:hypothetical protein, conserved [Cyanidioschyzon merolae strain 10D]|uniref:Purple acid phosphatase n=1 Tax=Cyanidioschyzon merolae (strain NIES-3377 / 10D) TaxID=280699 RepID=M1VGQ9_CYAM1|nr:hypothetical protein, conserved [Cyanidioschyzon merolae strain 10D]BAM82377.1 hypothetical protein, conserved [Cyanidioschyzon merolae strain 10D]|eukprot:XP_005538413.1 hypothetical protein, conserved [Cyanidioschyzon merolae strain 10D]